MDSAFLSFLWARARRDEAALQRWSCARSALLEELARKKVAIVGNSRALAQTKMGTRIDGADLVIRINRAPMPSAVSHGERTDWLALATSLKRAEAARIRPARILWMSHKRKRLPFWVAASAGFHLHPVPAFEALRRDLGAPPTTGLMIIDLVMQSQASKVDLYGFDFFASLSLTGSRTAKQVPHDFRAEKEWVENLGRRDPRLAIN
jgi:hypothetical protein